MSDIENITTTNIPMLDTLVYNIKKLALESVVKDQTKADNNETINSKKQGSLYVLTLDNASKFELFDYTLDMLEQVFIPDYLLESCIEDKTNIPLQYRDELLTIAKNKLLNNYVEENNYYRMLNGLPDLGDTGLYLNASDYPDLEGATIDFSNPIHKMADEEIDVLYYLGYLDKIITDNPTLKYLNYLGTKKVSIYTARKAGRFELLYVPSEEIPDEIADAFRDKYNLNKSYTLSTIYSDAYKFESDYYDNFIMMLIMIQTMSDMIVELPDYIIRKDVFDYRMARLFFETHGIDYFDDIPLRYQRLMIKNINKLIKYRSTTKNIIDICELFGMDNIDVFKYYILRDRKTTIDGKYVFANKDVTDEDGNTSTVEDYDTEYDLKFIKVPIEDNPDNYLQDNTKMIDYDEVTEGDKYWDGDLKHEDVKNSILEMEFNYYQSKYLSVDSIYDLTKVTFDMCYFYNIFFDNKFLEEKLMLKVPYISQVASFRLADLLCFLFAISYEYEGVTDNIMDTQSKILYIKGFNFDADLQTLSNYVQSKGYTFKDLGVDQFQLPTNQIMTYKQLVYIFTQNKKVYDHVVNEMLHANDKNIYDIYKKIYDSLFILELTSDFFKLKNGTVAKTYTDFIKEKNGILYDHLLKIKAMDTKVNRNQTIGEYIDNIVYAMEEAMNTDIFNHIFDYIPTVSAESIKWYIYEVVNFFKSYKVQFMGINIIYTFDRSDTQVEIIDKILINTALYKTDIYDMLDKIKTNVNMTKIEKQNIIDKITMEITYWTELYLSKHYDIKEIKSMSANVLYKELSNILDKGYLIATRTIRDVSGVIQDKPNFNIDLHKKEFSNIRDFVEIIVSRIVELALADNTKFRDVAVMNSVFTFKDHSMISDTIDIKPTY